MTIAAPQTFPYRETKPSPGIAELLPKGNVWTLLGRIQRIDLGWAGRRRVVLELSVGTLTLAGHRDSIPMDAKAGDWLRVKVRRGYEGEGDALQVLSAAITMPDNPSAWLPTALHHRTVHMRRLRALLARLSPELQLFFVLCMSDAQVQRGFFWRVAAADHHGYPGGLFDQSVQAAELAYERFDCAGDLREVAAMAALLFDVGKVLERRLQPDGERRGSALAPHPLTLRRIERALPVLDTLRPAFAAALRGVLVPKAAAASQPVLAQWVRDAVLESWGPVGDV